MPLLTLTRAPWRPRGPTPQRITELQNRLQRARQVLQAFKVEMRELPREYTGTYDAKAKQHHATLQKLHGDLQWAKTEGESAAGPSRNIDEMTSSEIIMEGAKIQDKSKAAVDRMKRQIEDSKQVGAETAQKLKSQTEQLKNVDQDIMKVKSNLKRADLLLRAFMRRMATDKIFMVFMCLIFCGIITIIALKAVGVDEVQEVNAPTPDELKSSLDMGDVRRRLLFR
eukprot:Transcript_11248.p1 GENE.Transcript_11248~~Transcript_11248.p1  ORF type:complete len:226 (-),score=117.73 Transcript_11248:123-800(-)